VGATNVLIGRSKRTLLLLTVDYVTARLSQHAPRAQPAWLQLIVFFKKIET
jgi:hypothetical protein